MPPLHHFILIYFCVYSLSPSLSGRDEQTYWNIRKIITTHLLLDQNEFHVVLWLVLCRFVVGQKPFHKSISSAFDCYLLIYDDIIWNDARCALTQIHTQTEKERERQSVKRIEIERERTFSHFYNPSTV